MIALTDQETGWLNELAGRLRLVQADSASANPQQRREYLAEEITRHLGTVPAASRKRYLEALLNRFPVAGQTLHAAAPPPAAPAPAPPPAPPPPETFDELFARFLGAARKLDAPTRAALGARLAAEGLGGVDSRAVMLEISEEFRNNLGLPPGQQPQLDHLVQLCIMLVEVFQRLDVTALKTMQELAPRSMLLKRPQDFRSSAAQYLAGQGESLEPHVRMMTGLLGALLAAMLGGGRDFGRQFVERLSPSAIEDVVMGEGKGGWMGPNKKERCWEKYLVLARDFETPDLVERRLRDCLAAFVEKKVLGGR